MDGETPGADLTVLLVAGTLLMVFLITVVIAAVLIYQRKILNEKMRVKNLEIENQKSITNAILSTQEEERRRIAQDLHDELGSMIFSLKMKIGELAESGTSLEKDIEENEHLIDSIGSRVRSISHDMMPPALKHRNLGKAISALVGLMTAGSGPEIEVTDDGSGALLERYTQMTLYRIISEWLNNLSKHSKATMIKIDIGKEKEQLKITIEDNGIAFDLESAITTTDGLGLKGIIGRMNQINVTYNYRRVDDKINIFSLRTRLNPSE